MALARAHVAHLLTAERLERLMAQRRVQVADLRPRVQWEQAHIPGARNVDLENFSAEMIDVDRELPIVIYGNDEPAAAELAEALRAAGVTAWALAGGFDGWTGTGRNVGRAS